MPQTDQTPDLLPNYDGTYNSYYPDGDKPEPPPPPEPGEPPVITAVTGTIAQGETITITGSNFSTYRASTLFFTDFSEGEIGESVVDAIAWLDGTSGTDPKNYLFSDEAPLTGTQIARADAVESDIGDLRAVLGGLSECYVEFAHRQYKVDWTGAGPQMKISRLSCGSHTVAPYIGITDQSRNVEAPNGRPTLVINDGHSGAPILYPYAGEGNGVQYVDGEWYRESIYMALGEQGEIWYRTSLRNNWAASGVPVFSTADSWSEPRRAVVNPSSPDNLLESAWLCWYTRNDQSTISDIDYFYANDSRERVMLSTSPTITASSAYHHYCCPTTNKTSSEIQAELALLDAMPSDQPVYLYVFNHDGTVNENGYLIREAE